MPTKMAKVDAVGVGEVFQAAVREVYRLSHLEEMPPDEPITVDVGVTMKALAVQKTGGVWGIFQKTRGSKESTLEVQLATRITVTKKGRDI